MKFYINRERLDVNTGARPCWGRASDAKEILCLVHEGSVRKHLETSLRIADEYKVRHHMKQRLEL